jgi:hypothetical protein
MPPLSDILNACSTAMQRMSIDSSCNWQNDYCAVVDPSSVLEMAIIIKSLLQYIEAKEGSNIVTEAVKFRLGSNPAPATDQ